MEKWRYIFGEEVEKWGEKGGEKKMEDIGASIDELDQMKSTDTC